MYWFASSKRGAMSRGGWLRREQSGRLLCKTRTPSGCAIRGACIGDQVLIAVPDGSLLKTVMRAYLLPLLGLLVGAFAGLEFGGEAAAIFGAARRSGGRLDGGCVAAKANTSSRTSSASVSFSANVHLSDLVSRTYCHLCHEMEEGPPAFRGERMERQFSMSIPTRNCPL